MKIALFGMECRSERCDEIKTLLAELNARCAAVRIYAPFYDSLRRTGIAVADTVLPVEVPDGDTDAVVTLGGDGTLLHGLKWSGAAFPLMGINAGRLGYLTTFSLGESAAAVEAFCSGTLTCERRVMLQIAMGDGYALSPEVWPYALNEVALLKADTSAMINVDTCVNGIPLTTYVADGLLVSTATGSTGYNLSVGGPILEPTQESLVLSPVAPHTLTMRPLVIGADAVVTATVTSRSDTFRISLDGRSFTIPVGHSLTLRRAPMPAMLLRHPDTDFAATLRAKLLWGR